ncbi:MAG: adenine deaminase [Candidatus Azotimanducaceae bacterium]|jgi:adenine deaminase
MALATHLCPSADELQRLRKVALGLETADLVITDARVLCLQTREILERNVVVAGAFIAAVTPVGHHFQAHETISAQGAFLAPTFIDTHIHIEYSLLTPGEFARCVIPRGTGCVLADPNCIGNVLGTKAMQWAGTTSTPLKILQQISHRIPRSPTLELGGATVTEDDQMAMLRQPAAVGVGESVPFRFDERAARMQAEALQLGKRNTGHSARVKDEMLWAYAATGISDDHNAFESQEVLDRIRLGMMITVMAGSMNDNVPTVFSDLSILEGSLDHFSFCADDKHVADLHREGHIDHHVRQAIKQGLPVLEAYRMASLSAAMFYRLDHVIGSITPTRRADFMLLDDLSDVRPHHVFIDGKLAGKDGDAQFDNNDPVPEWLHDTMNLSPQFGAGTFKVPADAAPNEVAFVRAMEMFDGYFKRAIDVELPVKDGNVMADPSQDIAKVSVVDRHHGTPTAACGFVRGFGLTEGAIAATTNCDNQNLVILGTNDADMATAGKALSDIGGGYVAVSNGKVLATLDLPLAGIMSAEPWPQAMSKADAVDEAAASIGCQIKAPFMILAFVGLAGVPDYGLTEKGLIDSASQEFIPVVHCCRCPLHIHDTHSTELPTD